jgi:hypothetical protein
MSGRSDLVEGLYHRILVCRIDGAGAIALAQPEDRFDDGELSGCCVKPCRYMLAAIDINEQLSVDIPVTAIQSLTTIPAPTTALPRFTLPATSGTCSKLDSSSWS